MFSKLKSSSISALFLLTYSLILAPWTCFFVMNQPIYLLEWNIINISSCTMTLTIILDMISLSFSNVVCLISGCVMLFSSSYMSHDPFLKRFIWLVMLFVLSMNMLVFISSLPAILLGWDGLGIVSFALVIYYQNMKSLGAGMLTVLANRIGDVMILISIGILVLQGHWIIVSMWDFHLSAYVVLTITIAAMTKSAQIPFSAWLPAAMAAPTPVSALVHSSTLVTAGVFLLIRFSPFLSQSSLFQPSLLFISVLTLLMAGIGANYENDLKKIIALSTLSQLGVMMMSLGMNMVYLSLFHLYTHALFKALLFLCAGMIIHNNLNGQDIRSMGLISKQAPVTVACLNIANLSLCGAPFLSGFYSKDLILETSLASPTSGLMVLLIFLATGMTAAYSLRLSFCSLWSNMKTPPLHAKTEKDPYVNWATTVLTLAAIVAGALFQSIFLPFSLEPFILPTMYKFLTIIVILLGLFLSATFWEADFFPKKMNKIKFFFTTMWFLAPISAQPLTKFSMLLGTNLMKSVDQGWLEILGGQGAFASASKGFMMNQKFQIKSFNFFILNMLFFVMMILLLMKI
uniref:NADH-ubiquinone oxidoreductase chain 5 n=1 Tax=Potamopyrgus antipodarum TaxID=145637 RepID=D3JAV5_POTAT|nr:NADH dehydrogenase subunit 5 [Potamopyrgus antipodarum]ADB93416.1 NADH dehydrogenase subunit 5 [Potamopyrgus antipodarum]ADB93442.1 NADH dehydrogenase subunit 5 [Potamopyrgus antipodarum]ADB93572.1 NADH dehydrogenase subunit 5 [Potamopyrgus antipodarum]AVY52113.1 NADH dehydrogenase subunit 5 [Potamopyrgus antipodarum]